MQKTVYIILVFLVLLVLFFFWNSNEEDSDFAQCLFDEGLVIYVTDTCPFCVDFAQELGGYDVVEGLFVNCNEEPVRCDEEKQTEFVPEIQYNGELYEGQRSVKDLAELTNCVN